MMLGFVVLLAGLLLSVFSVYTLAVRVRGCAWFHWLLPLILWCFVCLCTCSCVVWVVCALLLVFSRGVIVGS